MSEIKVKLKLTEIWGEGQLDPPPKKSERRYMYASIIHIPFNTSIHYF